MRKIVSALVMSLLVTAFAEAAIQDVRVSKPTNAMVVISWITDSDVQGEVHYSESPDLANPETAYDSRGETFEGCTHYVEIKNLTKETAYYFEVVSEGEVDTNNGSYYTFNTMKEPFDLPGMCMFYGRVYLEDGATSAEGAIVYLWVTHEGVDSYPLSGLVASNGFFWINIKEARSVDTDNLFSSISSGDPIHLEVVYCGNCTESVDLVFGGCTYDCGLIILDCSFTSTTTSIILSTTSTTLFTTTSTTTPTTAPTTAPTTTPTTTPPPPPPISTTTIPASTTTSLPSTTTVAPTTTTTQKPEPVVYEVAITPSSVNLFPLEKVQFSAQTTRDDEVVEGRYRWYIDAAKGKGGSISDEGVYRASAVADEVRVTVEDIDHGGVTAMASVTVSPLWPMMYDEMWGAEKYEKLHLLRKFRDNILAESKVGRECVFVLYRNSLEILVMLYQNPSLVKETQVIIDELQPGIESLLEGGEMALSDIQVASLESLLTKFETDGSPALRSAIKKVKRHIRKGRLFKQLKITTDKKSVPLIKRELKSTPQKSY